MKEELSFST